MAAGDQRHFRGRAWIPGPPLAQHVSSPDRRRSRSACWPARGYPSGCRALASTLLFASFLTVIGLFRLIAAARLKLPHWGWAVFDGSISLLLGLLLWAE